MLVDLCSQQLPSFDMRRIVVLNNNNLLDGVAVSQSLLVRKQMLLKHLKRIPHEIKTAFRACWFVILI